MNQATRRLEVARYLALREHCTAKELAAKFGVSARTILRDLDTLRSQGIALSGQAGVGGGFSIPAGEIPVEVRLKEMEILALWIASELALRSGHLAFVQPARKAVQSLLASIPGKRRRELLAFVHRIYLGPPASAAVAQNVGQVGQSIFDCLERAFSQSHCLEIRYKDMHERASQRVVEVHGIWIQAPIWYVLAYDHARAAPRMFRADRITLARPTEQRFAHRSLEIARRLLEPTFDPEIHCLRRNHVPARE